MRKIPVGKTISFAYGFTFGHIGTVIGLIWLPLVVYSIAEFFATTYYAQGMQDFAAGDTSALGTPLLTMFAFGLGAVFIFGVIGASLTRQALGLRTGPAIVQFGFGAAEFNLFLSYLAVGLVLIAAYIGLLFASLVLGAAGGAIGGAVAGALGPHAPSATALALIGGLAVIALVCIIAAAIVFFGVRLTFLLAPVTLSEARIDLIAAWTLTRGNFWRIFVIGFATLVPIIIVASLAEIAILGPAFFTERFNVTSTTDQAGQMKQMAGDLKTMTAHLPALLGLGLVLGPFTYGLLFSAPAYAYRALVGTGKPESPDMGPLSPA